MFFKFGDDRFRGLASAEGQILPFPIHFDGRPYKTLTLPCERVMLLITMAQNTRKNQLQGGCCGIDRDPFKNDPALCPRWVV